MMIKHDMITAVLMSDETTFSVVDVCQYCHLQEDVLMEWIAHGVLGEQYQKGQSLQFDFQMIDRIRTANRLQHDLEVNLQGAILALELMDEISKIRDELEILKRIRTTETPR